jgi:murein DD-endopeptidase MepM/ murein hydrolase activator NlpD
VRKRGAIALLLAGALVAPALGAGAQEQPPIPTDTTTTTTTTTAPPPTSPPTTQDPGLFPLGPEQTTTTTTPPPQCVPPPPPPASEEGVPPEETVPPTTTPPTTGPNGEQPPPTCDPTVDDAPAEAAPDDVAPALPPPPASETAQQAGEVFKKEIAAAEKVSRSAVLAAESAGSAVTRLEAQLALAERALANLERTRAEAVRRLKAARIRLVHQAVGAYTGDRLAQLNLLLNSEDVNDYARRSGLMAGVLEDSARAIDEWEAARQGAGEKAVKVFDAVTRLQRDLSTALEVRDGADRNATQANIRLAAYRAGSAIVVNGFVFPVAGPHRYSNDFGNPRMVGTPLEHSHQGTDIFAAHGTPLVACERGVVTRVGTDRLGGTKLWIVGTSGTRYYYAHLTAFAEGVSDGMVVEPGTLVGYVGDTGNARGGSPHLHFEVHPPGQPPVNPYPLLRAYESVVPPPTSTSSSAATPSTR